MSQAPWYQRPFSLIREAFSRAQTPPAVESSSLTEDADLTEVSIEIHSQPAAVEDPAERQAKRAAFMERLRRKREGDPLWAALTDGYPYDERSFVVFEEAGLDSDVDPKRGRNRAGFVGNAGFRHARDPVVGEIPFAINQYGEKITGKFSVEYDDLRSRIKNLRALGIRPSQSEKALAELDDQLKRVRRRAGIVGRVFEFPGRDI